jgi:hypothetical protein
MEARTHEIFATIPASSARDYKKFLGLVAKAGRAAELALLKGKVDEAFLAKQRQFQASIMAQSAKAFERSFGQLAKTFDQFRDRVVASVDQPFTDQIHRIMSDLGVPNRRDPQELARAVADRPLADFVKAARKSQARDHSQLPTFCTLLTRCRCSKSRLRRPERSSQSSNSMP